jgi:beta-lactamase regulating signal transducer with metallopeptidase domain
VALLLLPGIDAFGPKLSLEVAPPETVLERKILAIPNTSRSIGPGATLREGNSQPPSAPPFPVVEPFIRVPAPVPLEVQPLPLPKAQAETSSVRYQLVWAWGLGVFFLALRLVLSHRRVRTFVRSSEPAPDDLVDRVEKVARDLGIRNRVETRLSPSLETPFITGIYRPVLLLPARMAEPEFATELPAVVAHELSHVRTADLVWGWAFHLVGIVLWPHPLMWRVRQSHMAACEEVCDASAAEYIGSSEDYSRILARVAYALHSSPPAACGIAMARVSNVSRRLAALERLLPVRPLTKRRIAAAVVSAFAVITFIAALDFVRAEPEEDANDTEMSEAENSETEGPTLKIELVDATSGALLPDTTVELRVNINGGCNNYETFPILTDSEGKATLVSPATEPVAFGFRVSVPGYVPMTGMWYRESDPPLESMPDSVSVDLERGTSIGGLVQDENGEPIEGAKVEVSIYRSDSNGPSEVIRYSLHGIEEETGPDGRWTCSKVPPSLAGYRISLSYSHPEYVFENRWNPEGSSEVAQLRAGSFSVTLKQGKSIAGRVVDELGQPIAGATLRMDRYSNEKKTKSNEEGVFVFEHVPNHAATLLVTHEDYAPTALQAAPTGGGTGFLVELKPGLPLRGRVVDAEGNPIEGAYIAPDQICGPGEGVLEEVLSQRLETDSGGRFEWLHAPEDPLCCVAGAKGYQSIRGLRLSPGEEDHVITLLPPIHVSGKVFDAATREPIQEFKIIPGTQWSESHASVSWQESGSWVKSFNGGTYEIELDEGCPGMAVQARAEGYKPADSPIYPREASREIEFDFYLEKQVPQHGLIHDLEGRPLVGASVLVCSTEDSGYIRNGIDPSSGSAEPVRTDQEGRFEFKPVEGHFAILCLDETGFAIVPEEDFDPEQPIQLERWGRVEGKVLSGSQPMASEKVKLEFPFGGIDHSPHCYFDYRTSTDSKGNFVFEHVFPGTMGVAREIQLGSVGTGFRTTSSHTTLVDTEPGKTTSVQIGGTGQPVVGRFSIPPDVEGADKIQWGLVPVRVQWKPSPEEEERRTEEARKGNEQPMLPSYCALAEEDGSFRVEDIPSGNYKLYATVPESGSADPMHSSIGRVQIEFTVPPIEGERSDEPFDLGTVVVEPN